MLNNVRKLALVFALSLLLASVASISFTWAAAGANSPSLAGAAAPLGKAGLTPYLQQTDGLTINDIVGASYIPTTGELIVIGQVLDDPNRPVMDYDYIKENLVVAMRAVHSAPDDPAATIDPIPGNPNSSYHQVRFFGNITDTHYGYVFFESDRLLKTYALGRDNLGINNPFSSNVPGYSSFFDRWLNLHDTDPAMGASSIRWWFTPSLHLRTDALNAQTILFSNTQVILNWELMSGTSTPKMLTAAAGFRDHFYANYGQFAAEQGARFGDTALAELPQLFKLYGIAYWSSAEDKVALNTHGVNGGWLGHYPLTNTTTPVTTPVVSRSGEYTEGMYGYTLVITGGVGTNPPASAVPDSLPPLTGQYLLLDRPSPGTPSWHFNLPGDIFATGLDAAANTPAIAMAFDLSDDLIQNHSFEGGPGSAPWVQSPGGPWDLISEGAGYRGDYGAYLGGANGVNESIYQQVTIPAAATHPRLSYYWAMSSDEDGALNSAATTADGAALPPFVTAHPSRPAPALHLKPAQQTAGPAASSGDKGISVAAAYDFLYVEILNTNNNVLTTLQTISNDAMRDRWQLASFSLDGYQGQTIRVRFRATNDSSYPTAFYVDDVSLDIDPMAIIAESEGDVYLPIITRAPLADLYVQNNIGKTLNLTIYGVGSQSIPPSPAGSPYHWGLFLAGTYSWRATASGFSPATGTEYFAEGPSLMTFGVSSSASRPGSQADGNGKLIITLEP